MGATASTLVIFHSDNASPFPSAKTDLAYDQGQRVPLIVSSPLQRVHGRRVHSVVSALDLMPTMLTLTLTLTLGECSRLGAQDANPDPNPDPNPR